MSAARGLDFTVRKGGQDNCRLGNNSGQLSEQYGAGLCGCGCPCFGFTTGVMTAAVVIGTPGETEARLKAPEQARYIAVAARQAENDAVSLANELRERGLAVKVYSLANGWFAIALDHKPVAPARALLASLQQRGVLPVDAYLTTGERYQTVIWTSEGGGRRLAPTSVVGGVPKLRLSRQAPAVAGAPPRQSVMIEPGRFAGNQAVLDRLTTLSRLPEDAIVMAYFRDSNGVSLTQPPD
jgi:hypothetical protein